MFSVNSNWPFELPILFAAPFWIGMFWRRANRRAVWMTIAFSVLFFFVLPSLLPKLMPGLRENDALTQPTHRVTKTVTRPATAADVARHEGWVKATSEARAKGDEELLAKIGPEPPTGEPGENIEITLRSGGKPIFWRDGLEAKGAEGWEAVSKSTEGNTHTLVERAVHKNTGLGSFNADFLLYHLLGFDLSGASKAMIETLRLPPRLLMPFLVLIICSFLTKRQDKESLDRYYAKMRTVVDPDPEKDRLKLEASYANPEVLAERKIFPKSDWEFTKPRPMDWIGFLVAVAICFVIIGLLVWLAGIGA